MAARHSALISWKIGYRFAEISEFEGNDNGFLLQDVTFDFSGVFFEVGVRIHL